jgi:dolichol-phosphate mannosyltransferase
MTSEPAERFALVVPTLNESGNIRRVLEQIVGALSSLPLQWEIIVVDDNSTDGTADLVRAFAASERRIRLSIRESQRGLSGAIIHGWAQTHAELLGVIDADLQHPPEVLPSLLAAMQNGADIAIASRYLRPNSMDGWNPIRKVLSRISVWASTPLQRREARARDPLSGFFVVRHACIEGIEFQKTGFKLLLEVLAKGRIKSVAEIPFRFATRERGVSKANAMTGVYYLSLLLKLSFNRRTRTESRG